MSRQDKIKELKENAKMFGESLFLFKKQKIAYEQESKKEELSLLCLEIIPIFEAALNNCFQLRNLEKQERRH